MSLELRQKVNDQFQRKKLEFYKMYNKNPQGNKHQHERGKKNNKRVAYQVEGANQDFQGMDDPDVEEYEDDEYDDEDASPDTKSEKKRRKQEEKERKKDEKEKAKQDKARQSEEKKKETQA